MLARQKQQRSRQTGRAVALGLLLVAMSPMACAGDAPPAPGSVVTIDAALEHDLRALGKKRVFWGHHSVGKNIVEGLTALAAEAGVALPIAEASAAEAPGARFEHAEVGENKDPASKVRDFAARVRDPSRPAVAVAAMKFCYVDFDPTTDVQSLFREYESTVEALAAERPETTVLHVTVPLKAQPMDAKSRLKRVFGKLAWEDEANMKRQAYNDLLRARFDGSALFDLARVESTRPDGSREQFEADGRSVEALYPGYTEDGGHLSELGKRVVAREFARAVAIAVRAPDTQKGQGR